MGGLVKYVREGTKGRMAGFFLRAYPGTVGPRFSFSNPVIPR
jgi:hypothetical protein